MAALRQKREANVRFFLEQLLASENSSGCTPLFTSWPLGSAPFNSILLCQNSACRDTLRQFLIHHHIFAAVHWEQPHESRSAHDPLAQDLSQRLLTIPNDFRYSACDISLVVAIVSNFFKP
jgi:dTDP-4-amino-4,6-dideoxygalactose transaminase